jgi:Holliday junction resolvase
MTNYSRGRALEYDTRDLLKAEGYEVIRAAGSKGKIDLVAFKTGEWLFVQCKIDGWIPPAERAELWRLAKIADAQALVAFRDKGVKFKELRLDCNSWLPWSPDRVA